MNYKVNSNPQLNIERICAGAATCAIYNCSGRVINI